MTFTNEYFRYQSDLRYPIYSVPAVQNERLSIEPFLPTLLQYFRDISEGTNIATSCRVGVGLPAGQDFSLLHSVETSSGSHPACYPLSTWAFSPGVKRPECESSHSIPSSAKVKNDTTLPPLPPYIFMRSDKPVKATENFLYRLGEERIWYFIK
jgi:hypothetical protein